MRTTDRRFIKTEACIHEALVALLLRYDISTITIEDIIYEADINKSTFYLHYQSIRQLLSSVEDDFVSAVTNLAYQTDDLKEFLKSLLDFSQKNKSLSIAVFKTSSYGINEKVLLSFKKFLKPLKPSKLKKITDENYFAMMSLVGGELSIIRSWVLDGCKFEKEIVFGKCLSFLETDFFKQLFEE